MINQEGRALMNGVEPSRKDLDRIIPLLPTCAHTVSLPTIQSLQEAAILKGESSPHQMPIQWAS